MHYIFLFLFLIHGTIALSQINGISATKMAAFSVDQIPLKTIEFEPTFNYAQSGACLLYTSDAADE